MEIILKEDVANLGYKDDIVKVRDGYGRNFLIPQKKAVIASESAKKVLAENIKQRTHKIEKIKNDAVSLADKLKDTVLTVTAKTNATGKIFGAIAAAQLAEEFAKAGFDIDKKIISLKEPVKEVGSYVATVKIHREVSIDVPFEVVAEE